MKNFTILKILVFAISLLSINSISGQERVMKNQAEGRTPNGMIRCSTNEYEELLRAEDPKRLTPVQFAEYLAPIIQKQKEAQQVSSQSNGIIYIPVVVHVIHNGDAYGVDENIRDEQVISQITVMNQDYRKLAGTPGFNSNVVGADIQIEFVLAKVDPNGNPTNGIDRVNLCRETYNVGSFSQIQTLINTQVKPQTTWNADLYMNMWCVNWDGSGLLGYGQFPSNSILPSTKNTDGVVAGHSYFGSRTLFAAGTYGDITYDKGRTMTHEVGHFLGLRHIWGDGDCTADDGFVDTPNAGAPNYGCPAGTDSCPTDPGVDMIENYMDYTDDGCMNIFTNDQKASVVAVMNTFPRRNTLKTSTADLAITLFANDAEIKIENSCGAPVATCANVNPTLPLKVVSLYNRGTATLTSATITYNMDNGTSYTNNWTGSLAPNAFAYVSLANTAVNGTLNVSLTNVNGTTDQRATNNTATKAFSGAAATPLDNFNFTTYTFNLVGDRYGAETTWNIKNQAGTTLYSGGPYTNIGTNTTQVLENNVTWTLPANGCYTFTIIDSFGDGISGPTYGMGSYTIKTNSGVTTVATGGVFASTESKNFTNGTLGTNAFNSLNEVYVYPNPSKDVLNISIPDGVELPNNMVIYNSIGQLVSSKKIGSTDDLSVNTSSFSHGIYLITLSNENDSKTLRFIKK